LLETNETDDEEKPLAAAERKRSIATETNGRTPNEDKANDDVDPDDEEERILTQQESSRGKVKGSVMMHYFRSAERPLAFLFLVLCFVISQISASFSDIWVAFW